MHVPDYCIVLAMIVIVGAGFSGIGLAVRLKQAGRNDFIILERAEDLGGTWRDNHYPGCACDVPSHVYSYSFDLNPGWSEGYAPQAEILAYLRRVAEKHGVTGHIRYGHEVTGAAWDGQRAEWRIETSAGPLTASYLVAAGGPLSEPAVPELPGLESFLGTTFHSAHWNHDHDLSGERIAVVGTGASAIQFVPQIQPQASKMYVFQRTAPWIVPRLNPRFRGWQKVLMRRVPATMKSLRAALYLFQESRVVGFLRPRFMKVANHVARKHLQRQVPDPDLRRRLTPDYVIGCKRVLISDDYYPALGQPNVELVSGAIKEVKPGSVVDSNGAEHEVDTIIFGTGFEVTEPPIAAAVRGADGRTLAEHWRGGMQAYLGTTVAGFPNLFFMLGPNTGLGHNSMIYMIESQLNYILDALSKMESQGAASFDVKPEAQRDYNEQLQRKLEGTVWTAGQCQSWYLDASGRNTTLWPGWTFDFRRRLRHFDPAAYRFTRPLVGRPDRESALEAPAETPTTAESLEVIDR